MSYSIGDTIINGKYEVQKELGEGSYGQVYAVRDILTGQIYALKHLHEANSCKALEKKIKQHHKLKQGPHILGFHDYMADETGSRVLLTSY